MRQVNDLARGMSQSVLLPCDVVTSQYKAGLNAAAVSSNSGKS